MNGRMIVDRSASRDMNRYIGAASLRPYKVLAHRHDRRSARRALRHLGADYVVETHHVTGRDVS